MKYSHERRFLETLKKEGKYNGNTNVSVYVCDDIPADYINIIVIYKCGLVNSYTKYGISNRLPTLLLDLITGR